MLQINKYNILNFLARKMHFDNFINIMPRPSISFCIDYFSNQKIKAAEIGTFEGANANSMLINLNIAKIYLIDAYKTYPDYKNDLSYDYVESAFEKANKLLYWKKDKIEWIMDYSDKAIKKIKDKLDFVYIDGNHSYKYVKSDIELYYKKLKWNGVMGGHDIHYPDVRKAVTEFCNQKNVRLIIKSPDWFFIK